jgi:GTP-binding protein
MIRPIVALVGRPNVGKSTLFNRLIGRRQALVRDVPGVTRDRLYGPVVFERWQATAVDTGGLDPGSEEPLIEAVRRQVMIAVEEADVVVFVVDARDGVTGLDLEIAQTLRRAGRPVIVAANKIEGGRGQEAAAADFFGLGFGDPIPISAEHGRGVAELLEVVRSRAPQTSEAEAGGEPVNLAVIGRPNVGKSSLVNAMVGTERVLVDQRPGTTRDAVDTRLVYRGRPYVLVDTAGIRRKGKTEEPLEKLAVVMALRSLERSQVAVIVIDATEAVTSQDAHIAGYAHDAGRAAVLVVNKWDLVPQGMVRRAEVIGQIHDRLTFLDYAPVCFTSAVRGEGLVDLFDAIDHVARESRRKVPTAAVAETVRDAVARRPITIRGVPLTVQSAMQVGTNPPTFALRVNRPEEIHFSYQRYLTNALRQAFGFAGSPIRLSFRKAVGRAARARGGRP